MNPIEVDIKDVNRVNIADVPCGFHWLKTRDKNTNIYYKSDGRIQWLLCFNDAETYRTHWTFDPEFNPRNRGTNGLYFLGDYYRSITGDRLLEMLLSSQDEPYSDWVLFNLDRFKDRK